MARPSCLGQPHASVRCDERPSTGSHSTSRRGSSSHCSDTLGCGKTTALRVLAGFERPDVGRRVLVDGKDIVHVPAQKRDMGMVFQSDPLFPNMTARDNVAFGLQLRHQKSGLLAALEPSSLGVGRTGRARGKVPTPTLRWTTATRRPGSGAGHRASGFAPGRATLGPRRESPRRTARRNQIRALQQRLAITTVFVPRTTKRRHSRWPTASASCRAGEPSRSRHRPSSTRSRSTEFVARFVGISSRVGA